MRTGSPPARPRHLAPRRVLSSSSGMTFMPLLLAAATLQAPAISAERIREDVRVLASDEFAGRGPGEIGEQKTVEFLGKAFAAAGLEPGGVDGLWTQPVHLVRLDRLPGARMSLS